MKKKILLVLAIASLLVCIFAISVSASTIYKDSEGNQIFSYETNTDNVITSYEGSFPKEDADGNALTWYVTGTKTEGNDTVKTVISFVTTDTDYATVDENGQYSYKNGVAREKVVSVNFPEGITSLSLTNDTYGWQTSERNLLFIYFPSTMTEMEGRICQETPVIACEFHKDSTFKTLGSTAFYNCKNLREIFIPDSVTRIEGYNSYKNSGSAFYNCLSLSSVVFENAESDLVVNEDGTSNALTLTGGTFALCTSLTSITLPNRTVSIGPRAFEYANSLVEIRFGSALRESIDVSIVHCCPEMKYYYIPATWTTVCGHTFSKDGGYGPNDRVFFYAGTKEQFDVFMAAARASGNNHRLTDISDANIIEWDSSKDDSYYKELATSSNTGYVVYGYNNCKAFYSGTHVDDSNPCVINCDRCSTYGVAEENPNHNIETTITYVSFDKTGTKIIGCTNEGCSHSVTEDVSALFVCLGYSAQSYGNGGILVGFGVNNKAISEYADITGDEFKFGMFAGRDVKLGESDAVNVNGEALTGIASVDYTARDFDIVEFKVIGFVTDEHKDANLALGIYVIDGEDVSYVQAAKPNEGEKYSYISYNDLVF